MGTSACLTLPPTLTLAPASASPHAPASGATGRRPTFCRTLPLCQRAPFRARMAVSLAPQPFTYAPPVSSIVPIDEARREHALVVAAQRGEAEAFAGLVRIHQR